MEIIILIIAFIAICFVAGLVAGVRKMLPIIKDNARYEAYKKADAERRAKNRAAFEAELRDLGF